MASLNIGDLTPAIDTTAHDGKRFSLAALRGRFVVMYFYPRAFTPVCTIETRKFRDSAPALDQLDATIVGVSRDPLERQCDFANKEGVSFPLLPDPDESICRAYGVLWPLLHRVQRVTFVIDRDGRIAARVHDELSASHHVDGAIAAITALSANSQR